MEGRLLDLPTPLMSKVTIGKPRLASLRAIAVELAYVVVSDTRKITMILVGKKVLPPCFSGLSKPRYHQIRMRSTIELLKFGVGCKLERDHSSNTFLLTLRNSGKYENEHHLKPDVISEIRDYLGHAKSQATEGSVLITTGEDASFCQGFDYRGGGSDELAHRNRFFEMVNLFRGVVSDLVSFPTPTIAAINGYAIGAGLILGLSHDHLAMKKDTNSLGLDLLAQEMSLPPYFAAVIRSKVGSPLARRNLVLGDVKYNSENGKELGLLNMRIKAGIDAVKAAKKLTKHLNKQESNGKPYDELRQNLYPGLFQELGLTTVLLA